MAIEYVVFQRLRIAKVAWIYPRWFDQVQYLSEAYKNYDFRLAHGFWAGLRSALNYEAPQGAVHRLCAIVFFPLLGASRSGALDINILWFLGLQTAMFGVVWSISGMRAIAWIASGWLIALRFAWAVEPGSPIDFRLDWMASCAYGIALCAAVAGNGFRSTRWSVVLGVATGFVLLTRFLTAVYFLLIFFVFIVWLVTPRERDLSFLRMLLSAGIAVLMAFPVFSIDREAIYNYYWVGHISGPERALRDSHLGVVASLQWLISDLITVKIGLSALLLLISAMGMLWILGFLYKTSREYPEASRISFKDSYIITLAFFCAPALALVIHPAKASQSLGILVIPALWLGVLCSVQAARKVGALTVSWIAFSVMIIGFAIFIRSVSASPNSPADVNDTRSLNVLVDYVYDRSEECGLIHPSLAGTLLADGLSARAFDVMGFERHHRWLEFEQSLPTGLGPISEETALQQLGKSDFVFLLSRQQVTWPFDRDMMRLYPLVHRWCDLHLRHLADMDAVGCTISVYERATLKNKVGAVSPNLAKMLLAAGQLPPNRETLPPSSPIFTSDEVVLCSVAAPISIPVTAAYGPVKYLAVSLPEGLELDAHAGVVHGWLRREGNFSAKITATNSVGTTTGEFTFRVKKGDSIAELDAPSTAKIRVPVDFRFEAFSASAALDFIDINDLTTHKLIERIAAGNESRGAWQGHYPITFDQLGWHSITFRFVSFDAKSSTPYTYVDEAAAIEVTP